MILYKKVNHLFEISHDKKVAANNDIVVGILGILFLFSYTKATVTRFNVLQIHRSLFWKKWKTNKKNNICNDFSIRYSKFRFMRNNINDILKKIECEIFCKTVHVFKKT